MRKHFSLLGPLLLVFFALANETNACSCLPELTIPDELASSENVVTTSLQGFEEIEGRVDGTNIYRKYAVILTVEQVYKGKLRIGQTIRVLNGGGSDCIKRFDADQIGEKFLFFMGAAGQPDGLSERFYFVSECSRSKAVRNARDELNYLDNRAELAGKTRISGTVRANGEGADLPSVAGLTVTIAGQNARHEILTDSNGFFELWDVPPGTYKLTLQTPQGWKLWRSYVTAATGRKLSDGAESIISVPVAAKKHSEVRLYLVIDSEISGRILSPEGTPMRGVCVSAYWLTPTSSSFRIPDDCTDENGEFTVSELPPGKYRLDINSRGRISSTQPFETFYFPGVQRKADAEPVYVQPGLSVRGLTIRVAKTFPLITISGRLTLRDGQPIADERIKFEPIDDDRYESVEIETDENGAFRFEIPNGARLRS
jgi:hypothetical protein